MRPLNTTRLIGTPAVATDVADLRRLHSDPRVMATLSADGATFTEDQTRAFLARATEHWQLYGFGLWIFRDRASNDFVGYGGIKHARSKAATRSNWPTPSPPATGAKASPPKSPSQL